MVIAILAGRLVSKSRELEIIDVASRKPRAAICFPICIYIYIYMYI